jgi:hypothetical protein
LASTSSSTTTSFPLQPHVRILSINKNGGNVKVFDLSDGIEGENHEKKERAIKSVIQDPRSMMKSLQGQIASALRSTFLPAGFPTRTPPGYLVYSVWSWAQDLSTQLRSVLATQRILEGVGVGREGATALSALFNYLIRDGFGMAATLLFTYAASSRFRSDCKRWRIFADISVDVGITLEVAATILPSVFFLPMICMGNVFKAMCGVAAGACGGSINLHWAKGSDISDISAKFGAQHTVTAAVGLVFAGVFAHTVDHVSPLSLWCLYVGLTIVHIYANLRCMRLISFDYMNTIRMNLVLDNFFDGNSSGVVASPHHIALQEPLWFILPSLQRLTRNIRNQSLSSPTIHLGVSFNDYCQFFSNDDMETWKESLTAARTAKDGYLLSAVSTGDRFYTPRIVVCFLSNVTPLQESKAYFHAKLLCRMLSEHDRVVVDSHYLQELEAKTESLLETSWNDFVSFCTDAGWDLSRSELETRGYEIQIVTT